MRTSLKIRSSQQKKTLRDSQSNANSNATFQFVNNRSEARAQEQIRDIAVTSPKTLKTARQKSIIQRKENRTGLPDYLKTGIEHLSGYAMDDVKVHYNSNKPTQLQAYAYAQGSNIHLAPGQEQHLPHEAWHVVQQKQKRVKPTLQLKGKVNINDDTSLEKEADLMGQKAITINSFKKPLLALSFANSNIIQRVPARLEGDVKEDFESTDGQSASKYLDWLWDYDDFNLSAIDVNHAFLKDVATRYDRAEYGTNMTIIGQRLAKLKTHSVILNLGDSLTPLPKVDESPIERKLREEKEARSLKEQKKADTLELERMAWITEAHTKLKLTFKSGKNQKILQEIKEDKEGYIIYRGEWYERSLKILDLGTFGGVPAVDKTELLTVTDSKFTKAKAVQKERGGDDVKNTLNEWTPDISLAETYGKHFVMLIGLLDKSGSDTKHIVYPAEDSDKEKGVLADSRYPLKKVAILSITEKPNFQKKVQGGS